MAGGYPFRGSKADGTQFDVASDVKLEQVRATLAGIGSDTTPVPVVSNVVRGNGGYANVGSPSTSANNGVAYGNPFIPTGEFLMLRLSKYLGPGSDRTWVPETSGAFIWLEADLSGGTVYLPIIGTKVLLSEIPILSSSGFVASFERIKTGVNCRLGINFGTIGGTTGLVGVNLNVRN